MPESVLKGYLQREWPFSDKDPALVYSFRHRF